MPDIVAMATTGKAIRRIVRPITVITCPITALIDPVRATIGRAVTATTRITGIISSSNPLPFLGPSPGGEGEVLRERRYPQWPSLSRQAESGPTRQVSLRLRPDILPDEQGRQGFFGQAAVVSR